jgi:hypothetical protein
MPSMSTRTILAAALVAGVAGCGGDREPEIRLLAPAGVVEDSDAASFEERTGCRVDLRVYDAGEDVDAIAERRDTDVLAVPTAEGGVVHVSHFLVRATLKGGVVVTVPRRLASALNPIETHPAGRRDLTWTIREEGDNDECARRFLAYATSQ